MPPRQQRRKSHPAQTVQKRPRQAVINQERRLPAKESLSVFLVLGPSSTQRWRILYRNVLNLVEQVSRTANSKTQCLLPVAPRPQASGPGSTTWTRLGSSAGGSICECTQSRTCAACHQAWVRVELTELHRALRTSRKPAEVPRRRRRGSRRGEGRLGGAGETEARIFRSLVWMAHSPAGCSATSSTGIVVSSQ